MQLVADVKTHSHELKDFLSGYTVGCHCRGYEISPYLSAGALHGS